MEQRVDDVTSHDSDATIPTGELPANTRNDGDVMDTAVEVCRLKHQKSGYISHLARLYKEADVLILERGTVNDVTSILSRVCASFSKLEAAHATLITLLEPNERDAADSSFLRYKLNFDEFSERCQQYITSRPPSPAPSERSVRSNASVTSSIRAKAASLARKREQLRYEELLADQKLARLKEELATRQREVDRERELLRQRADLERASVEERTWSAEAVDAHVRSRHSPDAAHAQQARSTHDTGDAVRTRYFSDAAHAQQPARLPHDTGDAVHARYLHDTGGAVRTRHISDAVHAQERARLPHDSGDAVHTRKFSHAAHAQGTRSSHAVDAFRNRYTADTEERSRFARDAFDSQPTDPVHMEQRRPAYTDTHVHSSDRLYNASHQFNSKETTSTQADFTQLFQYLTLPPPELFTFSGESIDYSKFIENFEVNIEKKVSDNRQRLNYLIKYTKGEPRELIEPCVMLGEKGYFRAKDLLQERYGKSHVVAQAHVSALVSGPPIKANDTKGLLRLSLDLSRAHITLSALRFSSLIDNTETIRIISNRLPHNLHTKWVEYAYRVSSGIHSRLVVFEDLCKFVHERACVQNSLYGQDLTTRSQTSHDVNKNKPPLSRHRTQSVHQRAAGAVRSAVSLSTSGAEAPPSAYNSFSAGVHQLTAATIQTDYPCRCCGGKCRRLWECTKFRTLPVRERKDCVRRNKLCDNCFIYNHRASECKRDSNCRVTGCGQKHHTLIHPLPQLLVQQLLVQYKLERRLRCSSAASLQFLSQASSCPLPT